ncbi:DEAD/DEAH box helicase [Thiohalocapsa marina]|uniref:ATP-dependent RNA helicase RhlB n=1 Tax=Thiohalocapsa marina TaxID=424902 RepID=A0A5M8FSX3_9GAMM|nr:DEAD/DEAH box helicase [Thiohalocapsa marina]KAA6186282.1 DEAD/DEAH box helicase [Thiohalocapsa marina]
MPQTHLTDVRFDSFDLDPRILDGLRDAGFTFCTPIQAETLPIALAGRDVAGQAQTGTGKTAAFLVAAMQRLLQHPSESEQMPESEPNAEPDTESQVGPRQPRVIILAPTRELAVQIHKDALLIGRHAGLKLGLVYGGTGYQQQRDEIAAGVDILIGTPGRLIDYFKQRVFHFKAVEVVILDEADRMFDLGFIKDIRFVLRRMPPATERLGMLFSATLSYRVTELAYEHMNDPQMVEIAPDQITADRVTQNCYMVSNEEKIPLLIGLIRQYSEGRIMVFVNTKREGERVWGYLEGNGISAAMLSGDVPQKKRLQLLKAFQAGELPVMVATDVAARGLHIPGVSHVINYDLPDDAEDYVHRIGRTARAGEAGDAISFVCENYAFCLPDIEAYIGAKIPVLPIEESVLAEIDPNSRVRLQRRPRDERGPRGSSRRAARGAPRDAAGSGRGGASGRGRGRGRQGSERAEGTGPAGSAGPDAPPGPSATEVAAGGDPAQPATGAPTKKRRRRRKPRSGGEAPSAS